MTRLESWTDFKVIVDTFSEPVTYIEFSDRYIVLFTYDAVKYYVVVIKDSGAAVVDFEANYKPAGNVPTKGPTTQLSNVGVVGDRLKVDAELSVNDVTISGGCPTITGDKWRTELDTSDISLSDSSYTTLKTLSTGILESIVIHFSTDRVDVKINVDGTDIFDMNLDDLEDIQVGGSSSSGSGGGTSTGGIMAIKTGSKFCFTPPCGLTYTTLTVSAKAEQSNKKMKNLLVHYVETV